MRPAGTTTTTKNRRAAEHRAIDRGEPHGVSGQLNVYVLDVDSEVTGYGQHNRLTVSRGTGDELGLIYVREDLRGLPESTEQQRRTVAAGWQRLHPPGSRLIWQSSDRYETRIGESIEHVYRIAR